MVGVKFTNAIDAQQPICGYLSAKAYCLTPMYDWYSHMEAKTALVLSAGGMFGAYQAGAWREVSSSFRPDT